MDNINELVFKKENVKIASSRYPRLKWWEDDLHLVYEQRHEEVSMVTKEMRERVVPFEV